MRQVMDAQGRSWEATTVPMIGAHMRTGAILAFRPADEPAAEAVRSTIEFNSPEAAELAIRNMGEKELGRRLEWAKTSAGVA
ncbi:MAG TPA: hypothetical protein VE913_12020 [Longimicrobium sp.]|nr:hypothetical protein [Longimicrobium sp.]